MVFDSHLAICLFDLFSSCQGGYTKQIIVFSGYWLFIYSVMDKSKYLFLIHFAFLQPTCSFPLPRSRSWLAVVLLNVVSWSIELIWTDLVAGPAFDLDFLILETGFRKELQGITAFCTGSLDIGLWSSWSVYSHFSRKIKKEKNTTITCRCFKSKVPFVSVFIPPLPQISITGFPMYIIILYHPGNKYF